MARVRPGLSRYRRYHIAWADLHVPGQLRTATKILPWPSSQPINPKPRSAQPVQILSDHAGLLPLLMGKDCNLRLVCPSLILLRLSSSQSLPRAMSALPPPKADILQRAEFGC